MEGLRYGRPGLVAGQVDALLGPLAAAHQRDQAARRLFIGQWIDDIGNIVLAFFLFVPFGQTVIGGGLDAVVELGAIGAQPHVVGNRAAQRIAERIEARAGRSGACACFHRDLFRFVIDRTECGLRQCAVSMAFHHLCVPEFEHVFAIFGAHIGRQRFGGFDGVAVVRCAPERLVDGKQELVGGLLVGHFLPVDHAVDEIDRLVVARIGQQDPAIEHRYAARIDEFGLEADRRLVGEDLHVMVGDPAQYRTSGYLRQQRGSAVEIAFIRQFGADEADHWVVDIVSQVEQHRIGAEIAQLFGVEVGNMWEVEITEQAGPVVVGAHLHAALVLSDRRGRRIELGVGLLDIVVVEVLLRIARAEIAA